MQASADSSGEAPALPPSAIAVALAGARNERGIPTAVFIEDIAGFISAHASPAGAAAPASEGATAPAGPVEELYGELNMLHSKYKLMESQLEDGRVRAKGKIPELEASLAALEMLTSKQAAGETASTFYNLSDNVFVPATVAPRGVVSVWLGANVMLEYSYDEARALFTEQLAAATTKVATNSSDLAFLRDQVITTEVNLARVYNYSVKETRRQKLAAEQLLAAAAAPAAAPAATPTALQQA